MATITDTGPKAVLELNSKDLDIKTGGGKAANLSKLIRVGFKVQPGFVITTSAYQEFIQELGIDGEIQRILERSDLDNQASLESASREIQRSLR